MSYYFNSKKTNTIYSDSDKIPNAKKVKKAFVYKSYLDPKDTCGQSFGFENFFIKDGSLPYFYASYDNNVISSFSASYMPIMEVVLSSISGKYNLTPNFGSYISPYDITPMLYKVDLFKTDNDEYKQIISDVDFSKAGKITWRMSEENLRYFNYSIRGPNFNNYDDRTSAHNLCLSFLSQTFDNEKAFVYLKKNNINIISQSTGRFIKAKPNVVYRENDENLFGLKTHDTFPGSYTPPHITLDIAKIKQNAPNKKLKITIEGLYLYGNSQFGQTTATTTSYDTSFVNNFNSFSADENLPGTNPYCQALFYMIDNNDEFYLDSVNPANDYINNGVVYSNLKAPEVLTNNVPVVSNNKAYSVKYMGYNDVYSKEEQSLDDKNLWSHMGLHYVADNKMYIGAKEEIDRCTNWVAGNVTAIPGLGEFCYEKCPICKKLSVTGYDDNAGRWLKCHSNNIGYVTSGNYIITALDMRQLSAMVTYGSIQTYNIAKHIYHYGTDQSNTARYLFNNWPAGSDDTIWGVKVPIYTAANDTTPFGFYVAANYDTTVSMRSIIKARGACCDGGGTTPKMSALTNTSNSSWHWVKHGPGEEQYGWKNGEWEYLPYYQDGYNRDYKIPRSFSNKTITCPLCRNADEFPLPCYCNSNQSSPSDLIIKPNQRRGEPGIVLHHSCYAKTNDGHLDTSKLGEGWNKPYSTHHEFYRFKFYGLNLNKSFNGYIVDSSISGLSANTGTEGQYTKAEWDDDEMWTSETHPQIEEGKKGVFAYKTTTRDDFTDYRNLIYGNSYTPSADNTFIGDAKSNLSSLSSQWMFLAHSANKNTTRYWSDRSYNTTPSRLGIAGSTVFDTLWEDGTIDPFGNTKPEIAQDHTFLSTGMSPRSGTNYTYATVTLTSEIDLSNETRKSLHICYPYTTVMNQYKVEGIIPQISLTYELV